MLKGQGTEGCAARLSIQVNLEDAMTDYRDPNYRDPNRPGHVGAGCQRADERACCGVRHRQNLTVCIQH